MELELAEPHLYFHDVPAAADRMAAIIEERATAPPASTLKGWLIDVAE
jgi:hypothetical protein